LFLYNIGMSALNRHHRMLMNEKKNLLRIKYTIHIIPSDKQKSNYKLEHSYSWAGKMFYDKKSIGVCTPLVLHTILQRMIIIIIAIIIFLYWTIASIYFCCRETDIVLKTNWYGIVMVSPRDIVLFTSTTNSDGRRTDL
jgi:hypothetical protein